MLGYVPQAKNEVLARLLDAGKLKAAACWVRVKATASVPAWPGRRHESPALHLDPGSGGGSTR